MQAVWIVWLILVFSFVLIETFTSVLVSIWFCAGSLAALLFSLFLPNAYFGQILIFAIVSVLCLFVLRPMVRTRSVLPRTPTNADTNVGKIAQVIAEIQPNQHGRVHLEGLDWAASSDEILPVGSECRVIALDGVRLVVTPLPGPVSAQ